MSKARDLILAEIRSALIARGRFPAEADQMIRRILEGEDSGDSDGLGFTVMYFGKHRGSAIRDIPRDYLGWLTSQPWFRESHSSLYEAVVQWLRDN